MNIATTRGQGKTLSLPNILTYARIAAIPVVVGCVFAQSKAIYNQTFVRLCCGETTMGASADE
jgi:phosphatidylglycerophosphate synthase